MMNISNLKRNSCGIKPFFCLSDFRLIKSIYTSREMSSYRRVAHKWYIANCDLVPFSCKDFVICLKLVTKLVMLVWLSTS